MVDFPQTLTVKPTRKPSDVIQQTSNGAGGFLDSLLDNAAAITQGAFDVSYNVLRTKQLFENQDKIVIEDPNNINQPAAPGALSSTADFGSINPVYIGLGLGAVGLLMLFDK